ncbi:MAG TPA: CSLREA domain-containing protein, partial [Chloroflexia bacterium]|nr:CSLREA domain-containing protein [Chloroflexia bacterium]
MRIGVGGNRVSRRTALLLGRVFGVALVLGALVWFAGGALTPRSLGAPMATPTIDGNITVGEYGNHTDGQNAKSSGSQTWYVTWDENNLYVALTNANIFEGAVFYLDKDPLPTPNGGSNANGTLVGQPYDNSGLASLPFRADFVTYFKNGYREYRTANGAGGWTDPPSSYAGGNYADNGATNTRELAIPWSVITGSGRPASFNFLGYVAYSNQFGTGVYAQLPPRNPGGAIGTANTQFHRFYRVNSTASLTGTPPFSLDVATFVVNSTADTGDAGTDGICGEPLGSTICTLREAIQEANAVPLPSSYDTITFNIGTGLQTISPASLLPSINDPVRIDGTTQPGYAGTPIIQLTGTPSNFGLTINTNNSTVMGLVINNFAGAIYIVGGSGNKIQGNYIGTNAAGTSAVPNSQGIVLEGVTGNVIGGTDPLARNLISGNSTAGVYIFFSTLNTVQGNYIGTNAAGTAALPNHTGVLITASDDNTIGGTTAAARNLISGNTTGVDMDGTSQRNLVQGNYVGTNATGTGAIANTTGISLRAPANTVGGTATGAGNLISGNGTGVFITANGANATGNLIQGNYIGTTITG